MLAVEDHNEADAGPRDREAGTERLCVATRTVKPIADLIRFVVGPDGTVVPDVKRKLPGRGVWVTATRGALTAAVSRNAFARGFKSPVRAVPGLVELTDHLLERAALDALSMAHKAGLVEIGFGRVEGALAKHDIAALLHAAGAAPDGTRKVAAAAKRRFGDDAGVPIVNGFTSDQLDLALGRSNVVHAALLAGPASEAFLARYRGLQQFRRSEG
jgi:predicted RNA-binding protein YlxR (DUF448 family)